MIAFIKTPSTAASLHDGFLPMLPKIRRQARLAFRGVRPEAKDELVAEVVANAYRAFIRLAERGKEDLAYAGSLAMFAIRQVRSNRRVGGRLNIRDVSSRHAQRSKGIVVERLETFDERAGEWREVLVEDRHAGPAETAAARIDMAAWLRSLHQRDRQIAWELARGATTGATARKFKISAGRVSQLRNQLRASWQRFQGEPLVA